MCAGKKTDTVRVVSRTPYSFVSSRKGPEEGENNLENLLILCFKQLNLNKTLSSADNPFKKFGPRSGPTFCPDLIGVQTV